MVADDSKRTRRSRMPPIPLLPYTGLPEGDEGYYNNKQHQHGNENNRGLPTMVMLQTGTVEYSIRPLLKRQYTKHTKAEAFADDLLIMVRAE
jgi:hypothetical protein